MRYFYATCGYLVQRLFAVAVDGQIVAFHAFESVGTLPL